MNDGYRLVTRKIGLFVSSVGLALLVTSSPTKGPMPGIPGSHERLMHRALGWRVSSALARRVRARELRRHGRVTEPAPREVRVERLFRADDVGDFDARAWRRDSRGGRRGLDRIPPALRSKADVTRESEFGTTSCVLRARTTPWRVGKVESPRYGSVMLTNRFDAAQMNGSTAAGSICCA